MTQRPAQRAIVVAQQPLMGIVAPALQTPFLLRFVRLEPTGAEHRRQGQRNQQRHQDRRGQGDGELAEQPLDDAAHVKDGNEHHHQRQVHRQQRETHLAGADVGRLQRWHAVVDMPCDVFQHHNGVIHHQPGGQDQCHQRQHVERKTEQVHDGEGAHQRHRHRQRRDQCGAQAAEEQENQHDDQAHRNQQRALGLVQRRANHRRAVHGNVQVDAARHDRLQGRQLAADAFDGLDDVGTGLAVDDQQHRLLVVEEAAVVAVFHRIPHPCHVAETQRGAILVADDQRRVVGRLVQLVVGAHLPVLIGVLHHALGPAHIAVGDGLAHLVQRHTVLLQLLRLQFHPYRGQRAAADLDFADAGHLRQLLRQDGGADVVQLGLAQHLRCQRKHHDRCLGRIDLAVGGHAAHAAGQQVARGVDGRLHVAGSAVDIAIKIELDDDPGRALAAATGHLADTGDAAQRALQWRGHAGGHDLRAGAGQAGLHGDHRKIHVRQRRHR